MYFFFIDTATTDIYTLSLHDALPISAASRRRSSRASRPTCTWIAPRSERARGGAAGASVGDAPARPAARLPRDRKSTRLNSSHSQISYAVFCLKKKKKNTHTTHTFQI